MEIAQLTVGALDTQCYLASDPTTHKTLVIDPGDAPEYISEVLLQKKLVPLAVVATHGHFDHLLGAYALSVTYRVPVMLHPDDQFLVSRMRETARHFLGRGDIDPAPETLTPARDGERVRVGKGEVRIIHVPGHTPGSIALYVAKEGWCFVGDTMFAGGSVGRTDFSYASTSQLNTSIKKLLALPSRTILYPGHGLSFTVSEARRYFLASSW